jgi:putative hydrolase of the HAD superfamily
LWFRVKKTSCGGTLLPQITAIFWDIGGVLLTNAWDRAQRERALEQFKLDREEFQDRHEMVVSSLERGKIGFDEYLERTIFYRSRLFAREVFKDYVFSLSQPHREVLSLAEELARSGKYFMGTINNESRELNLYRIQTFGLREIFSLFVSSCFVGPRKPEQGIYRIALRWALSRPGTSSLC